MKIFHVRAEQEQVPNLGALSSVTSLPKELIPPFIQYEEVFPLDHEHFYNELHDNFPSSINFSLDP